MNSPVNWRTPVLVLVCGAIILTLGLGIRASFGLFLQPFFGAWADKKGAERVVAVSGLLYAGGLALMPFSTTPLMLDASAGLMVGLGLSGVSFGVILGVVGRAFPPERRSLALGIASSGGSFGQFLMLPFGQLLISTLGWQTALLVLAGIILATVPLATAMMEGPRPAATGAQQSLGEALREAGAHSGFWYLTAGFFVCGFQVAFISVHLPAYLLDVKMTPAVGATALALIGLFNIAGSFVAGYLGVRFVSMLFGIVFLSHQIGSFTGVWLGGDLFDATGSYDLVWIGSIALGVIAAILNLPIDERPVVRVEARPA